MLAPSLVRGPSATTGAAAVPPPPSPLAAGGPAPSPPRRCHGCGRAALRRRQHRRRRGGAYRRPRPGSAGLRRGEAAGRTPAGAQEAGSGWGCALEPPRQREDGSAAPVLRRSASSPVRGTVRGGGCLLPPRRNNDCDGCGGPGRERGAGPGRRRRERAMAPRWRPRRRRGSEWERGEER